MKQLVRLNNGRMMPSIGLGTWQATPDQIHTSIQSALKYGYSHIDCASIYLNEKDIGSALQKQGVNQGQQRQNLFVTSKLWNTHHKHVREACEKSLKDLKLEYLDLYLIHWPLSIAYNGIDLYDKTQYKLKRVDPSSKNSPVLLERAPMHETWQQMEQLVKDGLVKSIGVSNFSTQSLMNLSSSATIQPVVNQVEIHPYLSQERLVLQSRQIADIRTVAYSPLGSNRPEGPMNDPVVKQIAERLGKTTAQVLLRWALQRDIVVIPKSVTPERIEKNIQLFDFELSEQDMEQMKLLNKNERYINPVDHWGYDMFE